jgi:hypothetical protein
VSLRLVVMKLLSWRRDWILAGCRLEADAGVLESRGAAGVRRSIAGGGVEKRRGARAGLRRCVRFLPFVVAVAKAREGAIAAVL